MFSASAEDSVWALMSNRANMSSDIKDTALGRGGMTTTHLILRVIPSFHSKVTLLQPYMQEITFFFCSGMTCQERIQIVHEHEEWANSGNPITRITK